MKLLLIKGTFMQVRHTQPSDTYLTFCSQCGTIHRSKKLTEVIRISSAQYTYINFRIPQIPSFLDCVQSVFCINRFVTTCKCGQKAKQVHTVCCCQKFSNSSNGSESAWLVPSGRILISLCHMLLWLNPQLHLGITEAKQSFFFFPIFLEEHVIHFFVRQINNPLVAL